MNVREAMETVGAIVGIFVCILAVVAVIVVIDRDHYVQCTITEQQGWSQDADWQCPQR